MFVLLNPIDDPQDFDVITVAGKDSPGVCEPFEPTREYQWDVKVGKGAFGSTTTFTGRVPAVFDVTFTLWQRAHFVAWEEFVNRLKYDPSKIRFDPETRRVSGVPAYSVFHPSLTQLDVNSAVILKIRGLKRGAKNKWTAGIDFLEWFPPPILSVVATPAGATDVPGITQSPEVTAATQQLAGKAALYAQLTAPDVTENSDRTR